MKQVVFLLGSRSDFYHLFAEERSGFHDQIWLLMITLVFVTLDTQYRWCIRPHPSRSCLFLPLRLCLWKMAGIIQWSRLLPLLKSCVWLIFALTLVKGSICYQKKKFCNFQVRLFFHSTLLITPTNWIVPWHVNIFIINVIEAPVLTSVSSSYRYEGLGWCPVQEIDPGAPTSQHFSWWIVERDLRKVIRNLERHKNVLKKLYWLSHQEALYSKNFLLLKRHRLWPLKTKEGALWFRAWYPFRI